MMTDLAKLLWRNEDGQDIAEYAVMLAVILVIVIGTIRLIGGNANNVFSSVASGISQYAIAGDGTPAVLAAPSAVAVSPTGVLFITDTGNHRIVKLLGG